MSEIFAGLEPADVWSHFATLCATPRASGQEAALRGLLQDWAENRGLHAEVDAAGNLLIRKPASPGYETHPGVVLQAHLDMVCQKNDGVDHDFGRDPIRPLLRDGWLLAENTTLGADNGIGVALILAVLGDAALAHPPLEALFTVDEEVGMGGARGLAGGLLRGTRMLNLDSESWGDFYLGCAGGLDVDVERRRPGIAVPEGMSAFRIALRGLRGGHSGVDIHEERGNAIKLLVRVLVALGGELPLRLSSLQGGTARNALPREAFATLAVPVHAGEQLRSRLHAMEQTLREELAGVEDGIVLSLEAASPTALMPPEEQARWLAALHAAPFGVRRMSRRLPGVVETSNNLGLLDLGPDGGHCNFMVRSLIDSAAAALADEIVSLFDLAGCSARQSGAYPGWAPNPDSPLLATCQAVFARDHGAASRVRVIHAGLECGIIGARYPGLDIVSFGPDIRGPHAPGEAVEIASVARCRDLLTAVLAAL